MHLLSPALTYGEERKNTAGGSTVRTMAQLSRGTLGRPSALALVLRQAAELRIIMTGLFRDHGVQRDGSCMEHRLHVLDQMRIGDAHFRAEISNNSAPDTAGNIRSRASSPPRRVATGFALTGREWTFSRAADVAHRC